MCSTCWCCTAGASSYARAVVMGFIVLPVITGTWLTVECGTCGNNKVIAVEDSNAATTLFCAWHPHQPRVRLCCCFSAPTCWLFYAQQYWYSKWQAAPEMLEMPNYTVRRSAAAHAVQAGSRCCCCRLRFVNCSPWLRLLHQLTSQ